MDARPIVDHAALERLADRGWTTERTEAGDVTGMLLHPRLAWPWPIVDAVRLETERDARGRVAVRLLGRLV